MWRATSDKVVQRALAEAKAGRHELDIVETNAPPLESLQREGILQRVRSPEHGELIAAALPAHGEWVGSRLNVFVQAYNTRLVEKAEVPRSYADLLHPRWKGRLGIEAGDEDWFAMVVTALGEAEGLRLFRELVATNGVSVRRGHTLLANLVASGEVPFALTVYNFTAEQLKRKGAPFDWLVIPPAVARANGLARAPRAAPPRGAPLLRFHDRRGRAGHPRETRLPAGAALDARFARRTAAAARRSGADARPGGKVDPAVRVDLPFAAPLTLRSRDARLDRSMSGLVASVTLFRSRDHRSR